MYLEKLFGKDLVTIATKLGYSKENILILKGDIDTLKEEYPQIIERLNSCEHNRDKRDIMTYAKDLVCNWILEDYIFRLSKI